MAAEHVWHIFHIGRPRALLDRCVRRLLHYVQAIPVLSHVGQQSGKAHDHPSIRAHSATSPFILQALTSHDSTRTRIWFPMFSYFESSVDGIIPNEYTSLENICMDLVGYVICAKDYVMSFVRHCWGAQQQYVSSDFLKKWSSLQFSNIAEEVTAAPIRAANATVPKSAPLPNKPLTTPAKSHELTADPIKMTTATLQTNKLHQNNDFANNLDSHMRRFDKRLITDGDAFVMNYRGEVNKKVI